MDGLHSSTHPYISEPVPPEVSTLGQEDLEGLVECDSLLEEFVANLPQLSALTQQCKALAADNTQMAEINLSLNGEFENARDQTLQKVETLTALHQSFEELTLHHHALTQRLHPANLQEKTRVAAAAADEESETIAETFLDKTIDVDAFLSTYTAKRVEAHLRKFKGERLAAQLLKLQRAGF